jgi:tRNA A-37 threonylcarbamoyl transferase component Bud32
MKNARNARPVQQRNTMSSRSARRIAIFLCARLYWRVSRLALRCALPIIFPIWKRRYVRPRHPRSVIALDRVGMTSEQLDIVRQQVDAGRTVVLAAIDRDSLFAPRVEGLRTGAHLTDDYRARSRTQGDLVTLPGGTIGVRKRHPNRWRFFCELRALQALHGHGCRVPDVLEADFEARAVISTYIPGPVVTDILAPICTAARDRDYDAEVPQHVLHGRARWASRLSAMRDAATAVLPASFGAQVAEQVRLLHRARVIWGNVKYGNIVIEEGTGLPWLVDFDYAGYFPRLSESLFMALSSDEAANCAWHFANAEPRPQREPTRSAAISIRE